MAMGPFALLGWGIFFLLPVGFFFILPLLAIISIWLPLKLHIFMVIFISTTYVSLLWAIVCGCIGIDVYHTRPFSYFWRRWSIRFPQTRSNLVSQAPQLADSCMTSRCCEKCLQLVKGSRLLVGSKWVFTQNLEWHSFHLSLRDLQISSQGFCHLCTIFWCSIPEHTRRDIEKADTRLEEELHSLDINPLGSYDFNLIEDQNHIRESMRLWVKVWEEPSEPWYDKHNRYMQIYRGQDPICKELLIYEGSTAAWPATVELGRSTGSHACIPLAQGWLRNCELHHRHCNALETSKAILPTRLIYVGNSVNSSELHLHTTSQNEAGITYLALSHCWGGLIACMLTSDNYDRLLDHINWEELPRNFQDAVSFTRQVGFAYLWIDSLCIIQDSQKDWELQAQEMSNVYAQAFCTISSCGSFNSDGGCFHNRNPLPYFPCDLVHHGEKSLRIRASQPALNCGTFAAEVNSGPLSRRAWAFQERLLSRRIVHFGATMLFFECNTLYASERQTSGTEYRLLRSLRRDGTAYSARELGQREDMTREFLGPRRLPSAVPAKYWTRAERRARMRKPQLNPAYRPPAAVARLYEDAMFGYRGAFDTLRRNASTAPRMRDQLRLHQRWFELVAMYTRGQLTQSMDRLIGMSGIAKAIQGDEKGLEYLGGLWRHHLLFDLLWCQAGSPKPRPTTYRAPSWSWVAVEGTVCQRLLPFTEDNERKPFRVEEEAQVCGIVVTQSGVSTTNATALIDGGYLDLKCRLLSVSDMTFAPENQSTLTLQVAGSERLFVVGFTPDIVLPDPAPELFCAEILRTGRPPPAWNDDEVWLGSTQGLVLRQIHCAELGCGGGATYERIGRFCMPLKDVTSSQVDDGPFGHAPLESIRII